MKAACRHCGKTFSAPESWRNTKVRCPQCNGSVLVGSVDSAADTEAYDETGLDDDELRLAPETERPTTNLYSDVLAAAASSKPAPKARRAAPAKSKTTLPEEDEQQCPNCAAPLRANAKLCGECGYHLRLKRVIDIQHDDEEFDDSTGFQRWLRRNLSDGESFGTLLLAAHAVIGIAGIFIAGHYHPWGWAVLVALVVVYGVWIQWVRKQGGLDYLGEKFWRAHLGFRRMTGWRAATALFKPMEQFTSHSPQFGDEQLAAIPNLELLEVLDLEGTSVTNQGLRQLTSCPRLRYVVLYRTRVKADGARKLQMAIPSANLWHD